MEQDAGAAVGDGPGEQLKTCPVTGSRALAAEATDEELEARLSLFMRDQIVTPAGLTDAKTHREAGYTAQLKNDAGERVKLGGTNVSGLMIPGNAKVKVNVKATTSSKGNCGMGILLPHNLPDGGGQCHAAIATGRAGLDGWMGSSHIRITPRCQSGLGPPPCPEREGQSHRFERMTYAYL